MKSTVSFVDLFSGAGGWTLGLSMAGMTHLASIDNDPDACGTAKDVSGGRIHCVDATRPPKELLCLKPRVVVGSPPCQGFSTQGVKVESDPRNTLVWTFLDLVEHFKPEVWLFENVPGFASMYAGRFVDAVRSRLNAMSNYETQEMLLDASDYGVPQTRKRFFIVGSRDGIPLPVPTPTHGEPTLLEPDLLPRITFWEAVSDLPTVGLGERLGEFTYDQEPSNAFQEWARHDSPRVTNHTTQKHSDRVLDKIRKVKEGERMSVFLEDYEENTVDYMGGYRRAIKDLPSYTAYWTRGMTSIHPEQDRFLSPRECARIQSFPDVVHFSGKSITNYRLICNAVPPLLAKAWGTAVRKALALA